VAQGSEFPVNAVTTNYQSRANVAMDADGDFAVVWNSYITPPDGDDYGIFARTYRANGTPDQTQEFLVNQEVEGDQEDPVVAMDDTGDFAVSWGSSDTNPTPAGRYPPDVILRTYADSDPEPEPDPDPDPGPTSVPVAGVFGIGPLALSLLGLGAYLRRRVGPKRSPPS
jgi:hypothetical protein